MGSLRGRGGPVTRIGLRRIWRLAVPCCLLLSACVTRVQTPAGPAVASATTGPCAPVLDHDLFKGVVGHMNKLKSAPVLWNGYRPDQGHYVFTVPGPERQRCAVVWRDGAIVDVLDLAVAPRLLTPLFGVLLPEERIKPTGAGAPDPAGGFRQPDQLRDQLRGRGVSHTVFIPLGDLPKMPFQLGSFEHFDLAVHEAFHTFVQTPSWVGMDSAGAWPSWDRPYPDRLQLATRCYGSATPQEQQRLRAEKAPLVTAALGALTSGNAQTVCRDTADSCVSGDAAGPSCRPDRSPLTTALGQCRAPKLKRSWRWMKGCQTSWHG